MKKYIMLFLFPVLIFALPKGEKIIHGKAKLTRTGSHLVVEQHTNKAIINWDFFSIAENEKASFLLSSSEGVILNRITGPLSSEIYGSLFSNGTLFLINEKGIIVGPSGEIKTKSFIGSCLPIENHDFLKEYFHFKGESISPFVNEGTIQALKSVYLIAPKIEQKGHIKAEKQVALLSGTDLFFEDKQHGLCVKISGKGAIEQSGCLEIAKEQLQAAGGHVSLLAVNQEGYVHANKIEEKEGQIFLVASEGSLQATGSLRNPGGEICLLAKDITLTEKLTLDVSNSKRGGKILVGKKGKEKNEDLPNTKKLFIQKGVFMDASAKDEGRGGEVILWAHKQNIFQGEIHAKGGAKKGNGGRVQISSLGQLFYKGKVNVLAPCGQKGRLFIEASSYGKERDDLYVPTGDPAFSHTTHLNEIDTDFDSNHGSSTYKITGPNSGNVNNTIFFSNIKNIKGGSQPNTFIFSDGIGLEGHLNGGSSIDKNLMDYSAFTSPATITCNTPTSGTATNLKRGWSNFACLNQGIIGNVIISFGGVLQEALKAMQTQVQMAFLPLNDRLDRSQSFFNLLVIDHDLLNGLTWNLVNSGHVFYDEMGIFDAFQSCIKTTSSSRQLQELEFFYFPFNHF